MTTATQGTPPAEPKNAAEATQRLGGLYADPAWTQRLLTGDNEANREFRTLTELEATGGEPVEAIVSGVLSERGQDNANVREMIGAAEYLRDAHVSDDVIRQALEGRPVTPQEFRAVQALSARRQADTAWTAKLLSGDGEAKRELALMSIVLSSEISAEAK